MICPVCEGTGSVEWEYSTARKTLSPVPVTESEDKLVYECPNCLGDGNIDLGAHG